MLCFHYVANLTQLMDTKSKGESHPKTKSKSAPCTPSTSSSSSSSSSPGRKKQPASEKDASCPKQEKPIPNYLKPTISSSMSSYCPHQARISTIDSKIKKLTDKPSSSLLSSQSNDNKTSKPKKSCTSKGPTNAIKKREKILALGPHSSSCSSPKEETKAETSKEEDSLQYEAHEEENVLVDSSSEKKTMEETASKQAEVEAEAERRNKVKALVGAFENVINESQSPQNSPKREENKSKDESQQDQLMEEEKVNSDEETNQTGQQDTMKVEAKEEVGQQKVGRKQEQEEKLEERNELESKSKSTEMSDDVNEDTTESTMEGNIMVRESTIEERGNETREKRSASPQE